MLAVVHYLSDLTKMAEMNLGAGGSLLCNNIYSTFSDELTPRSLSIVVSRVSFHHNQNPYLK